MVLCVKLIIVRLVKKYANSRYNKKYHIAFTASATGFCPEPDSTSAQLSLPFLYDVLQKCFFFKLGLKLGLSFTFPYQKVVSIFLFSPTCSSSAHLTLLKVSSYDYIV